MAGFNEILAGRFNRALQKFLSMKGPPPSASLAPEMMPVFPFALTAAEFYLHDWYSFGQATIQTGVAAVHSAIRFRNPLSSGVIVLFESLHTNVATSDTLFLDYGTTNADLNTVVATGNQLDAREKMSSGQIGSLIVSRSAAVDPAGIQAVDTIQVLAAVQWQWVPHEDAAIPLLPGDALQFRNNTVNIGLGVGARWRQRPLEDSEVK